MLNIYHFHNYMWQDSKYNLFYIFDAFTPTSIFNINPHLLWITLFPSNLHLHLYAISFVKNFYSFFNVIMLKTCIFKSSVLFETNTLLDKSLRVLQFPTHLSNPTANLKKCISCNVFLEIYISVLNWMYINKSCLNVTFLIT